MCHHRIIAIGLLGLFVIVPFGTSRADLIVNDLSAEAQEPFEAPLPPRGQRRISADQMTAAFNRMRRRAGEVPAHIWMARNLLARRVSLPQDQALQLAEDHLSSALQAQPKDPRTSQLLAQVYRVTNRLPEAIALLEPISDNGPAIRLQLAAISLESELGKDAAAKAEEIAASYQARQKRGAEIGPREYGRWVRVYMVLGKSEDAFAVLEQGLLAHPDDALLRRSLVDQCLVQFDKLARRGPATAEDRLAMIRRAMELAPEDSDIQRRVAALSAVEGAVGQQCRKLLQPLVTSDEIPDAIRLPLARTALRKKDYTAARQHFRRLHKSDPTAGGVMITLAQLLAFTEPIDLPAALSMANKAVEQAPENARFRQNRGQVLLRLERWQEAIADLEMALNGMPNRADIHESLANAYEKTGESQVASSHRRQAEELQKADAERGANRSRVNRRGEQSADN